MPYWSIGYLGIVWDLLFWALLIAVIIWLLKNNFQNRDALELLKRKYVRGEISRREFEEMKRDLRRN